MPLSKTIFRQNCLKKIKNSSKINIVYKNSKLNSKLLDKILGLKKKKILLYIPLPFEANIAKTIKILRKKHDIFVPFMEGESFKMVPFRLPLKKKKFGIYEAGNSLRDIKNIDIAVVPIVGMDGKLQRVGFGKGMYDRFFAKLKKRPYIIFVQSDLCQTKEFICDDYDITCNILITPHVKIENKNLAKAKNRK
ncbi:5-formyltetrahydrofolate cyclo-ligase [Candidatus Sulfurimonas marisnigri]|uniref:5-formyltetrahydrofolate cyclo-ligase n=1 Tax=Candidatus Sulfurimonas marisnigri TaxID=2740405 RepID=A0A7S7M201_9BACT|nr:5-formyltetrahydrofolate cyclo-ligase [Candidatus Sulfurimonas marisnigri]QOY55568.1 5-formyltetrahydrofolate cyclo-ligase [Candidatus Sulfurimonas marisnigri]